MKDLFTGNETKYLHNRFIKYGKGTFDGPALTLANDGTKIKAEASLNYADTLAALLASLADSEISGFVISREEIEPRLKALNLQIEVKSAKSKGFFNVEIAGTLKSSEAENFYSTFKEAYVLCDIKPLSGKGKLKTKKKLPKPGSKQDAKFCSAVFDASAIEKVMKSLCFDVSGKEFGEIAISHKFTVTEIVIPDEYKTDFKMARIHSRRKGVAKRKVVVDGKATESEKEFEI